MCTLTSGFGKGLIDCFKMSLLLSNPQLTYDTSAVMPHELNQSRQMLNDYMTKCRLKATEVIGLAEEMQLITDNHAEYERRCTEQVKRMTDNKIKLDELDIEVQGKQTVLARQRAKTAALAQELDVQEEMFRTVLERRNELSSRFNDVNLVAL